ncbi:MAG TPA: ankyrin repeat domain-containing protein [Puia sp.]|nr:ankyrin repeat domain-containing protein [Puia sp.]
MKNAEIGDPLFREAVEAIDAGDTTKLESLLVGHPELVRDRLDYPSGAYFKDPWLLYFVADNPIRADRLPENIVEVTRLLIGAVKREATGSAQEQLDYTLGLVATGRIPRECGVQIAMIDLLIDEGARPGGAMGALAHGNIAAAERLIGRGGMLTLAAAVGLDRMDDVERLAPAAGQAERLAALTVAAFYGKSSVISWLLGIGTDPNGYVVEGNGFHSHATPLHQAVYSGVFDAVKLLVEAGARLDVPDKVYGGTPLGWAEYIPSEAGYDEVAKTKFAIIASYLRERGG